MNALCRPAGKQNPSWVRKEKQRVFALPFAGTGVMNQVLRNGAREERKTTMLNAETNDTAATVAEQGAPVAPEMTTPTKATSRKKGAPKGRKKGNAAKPRDRKSTRL